MPAEQIRLGTYEIRNCRVLYGLPGSGAAWPGAGWQESGPPGAGAPAGQSSRAKPGTPGTGDLKFRSAAVRVKDGVIEAVEYCCSTGPASTGSRAGGSGTAAGAGTGDPAAEGRGDAAETAGRAGSSEKLAPVIDLRGAYLVPGLVELHIHGCGEIGIEQSVGRPEVLEYTARFLSENGVNTFLPTIPCSEEVVAALADILESNPKLKERVPGIYVEGPFVNSEKRGGIDTSLIRKPDPKVLDRIIDRGRGHIRMMTVAPELPGADEAVEGLLKKGIVPCFGHSNCTAAEALGVMYRAAGKTPSAAGAGSPSEVHGAAPRCSITHLFNAMSGIFHKRPGLAVVPFLEEECFFELNGDGIHVADELLRLCFRHLRKERMLLISDAVISAGLDHGEYTYFGRDVVSDDKGVRYAENGVLIGSNRLIPRVCRHFARVTGAALGDVLPMVTENPFRLLSIEDKGAVRPGMRADLIAVDDSWEVLFNFLPY